jgi:hypothetical protein
MDDRPFRNIAELKKLNLDDTSEIVIVENIAMGPDGAQADAGRKRYARKGRQRAMQAADLVRCSY